MLNPAMIRAALPRLSTAVVVCTLVLSGCASNRPDPQALVSQAVRATQSLTSVQFAVSGQLHFWSLQLSADGVVTASGTTTENGKAMVAALGFDGELGQGDQLAPARIAADLSLLASGELAVRAQSLDGLPFDMILPAAQRQAMLNRWVRVVAGSTGTVVTPEPQLLDAQAQVVTVTEDLGRTTVRGKTVEHYRVALDKEKFAAYLARAGSDRGEVAPLAWFDGLAADGELWIDPQTAFVHRVRWSVLDPKGSNFSLNLTVDLSAHNAAEASEAPTQLIDLQTILTSPLPSPSTPDA